MEPKQISPAELKSLKIQSASSHVHFDVRNTLELATDGHIPLSRHIPLPQLKASHLPEDKSSKIVFSCLLGGRSMKAARQAIEWGYSNVYNMEGGFNAWKSAFPIQNYPGVPIVKCFHDLSTGTCQYVVYHPETKDAAIIDSVLDFDLQKGFIFFDNVEKLVGYVREHELKVHYILETHAHADHISASQELKKLFCASSPKVCIGEGIKQVQKTFSPVFNMACDGGKEFDHLFQANEEFSLGDIKAKVISFIFYYYLSLFLALHVPGHTPDHLAYLIGDSVFVGDSIFMPDSGSARCDFPGGSAEILFNSVRDGIFTLDENVKVFVGHDYPSKERPLSYQSSVREQKLLNKHLKLDIVQDEFIQMRQNRDKELGNPKLLFPSMQCNIKAGHLPTDNNADGDLLFKIPVKRALNPFL